MPIEDYIPQVFGSAPVGYEGLLGAERTQGLQKTANLQGLLGAAGALAQGLSAQGPRRSALQNILGAIGGGFQGSQGAYQQGLQQYSQQQEIAKAQRAATLQSQKDAVMQKLQRGETLTSNDYAILNPEEAAKTQYQTMQLSNIFNASPINAQPVQGISQNIPLNVAQQPMTNVTAATAPYAQTSNVPAPIAQDQSQLQAADLRNKINLLNQPNALALPNRKEMISTFETQLKDIDEQLKIKREMPIAGDPFAAIVNDASIPERVRRQAAIESQRANQPSGFATSQQKAEAFTKLQDSIQVAKRQDQLVANPVATLGKLHPTLAPRIKSLSERASSMTPDQIVAEQNDILKADSNIREKLDPSLYAQRINENLARSGATYETPEQKFQRTTTLRKEYEGQQIAKDFTQVKTAYSQIKTALNNPSPAADLAAATKFMKLLDPNSVVRESELGMAMAASGVLDRAQNYFKRLQSGEKLTPVQRADFAKTTELLYKSAENVILPIQNQFRDYAIEAGVNPNSVVNTSQQNAAAAELAKRQGGNK